MLNWFARVFLVATSLSPILGAVAISQLAQGDRWKRCEAWVIGAVLAAVAGALVLACHLLLRHAAKNAQTEVLHVAEFDRRDHELVAFLLAYLLPLVSSNSLALTGQLLVAAYLLGIIVLVVAHAGAFHFNPVMGVLHYHFYAVKDKHGASQVLISKKDLRRANREVTVVRLSQNIFLHKDDGNA